MPHDPGAIIPLPGGGIIQESMGGIIPLHPGAFVGIDTLLMPGKLQG